MVVLFRQPAGASEDTTQPTISQHHPMAVAWTLWVWMEKATLLHIGFDQSGQLLKSIVNKFGLIFILALLAGGLCPWQNIESTAQIHCTISLIYKRLTTTHQLFSGRKRVSYSLKASAMTCRYCIVQDSGLGYIHDHGGYGGVAQGSPGHLG